MKSIIALVACWMSGSSLFAAITITPASRTFDKDGGGGAILTAGSGTWTASTTADWITITPTMMGNAGESVVYIVNSNFSADTRVGTITVSGNTHTITQTGYDASINPVSATFDFEGGYGELEVTTLSGVSWTARSNASWITLTSTMGLGSGSLSYEVAANSSVTTRTGTITVAGQTYNITQTGVDVTLSPVSAHLESSATIVLLTITALNTTAWTVEPCSSWISVVSGGSGYGGGSATLAVAANPSWLERTGTVKVGSATLTIRQRGTKDLSFAITPETATAASDGAYGNVAVIATPDAPWTAESEASWITLSSGQSGAGNGNIQYVVSPNTTLSQRTGTIKITPPVVVPDVDLYRGLLFWIKDQKNIEGNELRQTSVPLSTILDGSKSITFSGAALPKKGTSAFSFSVSFKVGSLDCINRLFQIGKSARQFYLDADNVLHYDVAKYNRTVNWKIEKAGQWYTMVISHDAGANTPGPFKLYIGERGKELTQVVNSSEGVFFNMVTASDAMADCVQLGQTSLPSSGYLGNGQFANIRFWTRALTDRECECVDTKQNEIFTAVPKGVPNGVKYDYLPLMGNLFMKGEAALTESNLLCVASGSGWMPCTDRFRLSDGSMHGQNGTILIDDFSNLFEGGYVLNGGYPLGAEHYKNAYGDARTPFDSTATAGSETDLTMVFWIKLDELPQESAQIFSRTLKETNYFVSYDYWDSYHNRTARGGTWYTVENAARNKEFLISVLSNGGVRISGSGVSTTDFLSQKLVCNRWYMIALVAKAETSIQLYVDGVDAGNISSSMTLGYLPPLDRRPGGDLLFNNSTATFGGWNGAFDDLTIYHKALSAKEIGAIYSAGIAGDIVYHTVTQGAASPSFDKTTVRLPANGGVASVDMTLTAGVNWTAKTNNDWLTIADGENGTGSATITFSAGGNPSVYEREGSLTIAGETVTVIQEGLNAAVSYDEEIVYGTDGGSGNVSVMAEANGSWTAASDVDWITVALGASGSGNGTVMYVVAPYDNITASRIGTLTIAGKKVFIAQRGYAMSIDPHIAQIGGNSGSGSVAVSAPVGAIWEAVAKESWITITGGQSGSGSGTLTYSVNENTTGAIRAGTIVIAGEAYKITQMYRVVMSVGVEGRGSVTGAGNYDSGADVTLTATPEAGYQFSHWSGAATGTANPATIKIDEACRATAHFTPIVPAASATTEEKDGVVVSWGALAWADQYRVYRAESNEKPDAAAATVDKETLVWNDTTAFPGKTYYYWVEAIGSEEQTVSASVTGSRAVSLASVAISCVGELFAGDSASCSCTAAYNDGTSKGVTPSWSVEGTSATVDKSGELTAGEVEADSVVMVRASFTEGGITKTASAQVAIYPKVALDEAATGIGSVSTGGSGTWFGQKKESCGGAAALRSPRVASGMSAWVGCSVTGAGTLTFKWRKQGANAGKLSLAVNDGEVAECGEASDSWASVTKEFYDSGEKDFKWIYAGGGNVDAHGLVSEIKWTPGTAITVSFNANGGSGSMTGMTFLQGADKNLPANAFTRTGYAFAGWATSADGEVAYLDGAAVWGMTAPVGGVVMLYAVWTPNAYTVRFAANGGEGTMADEPMTYDVAKALTACVFTRKGYTFAGWAAREGADSTVYADGEVVSNLTVEADGVVTLYAKWTPNNYVIDFNPGQGGTGTMSDQPMTYDEEEALYLNLFARTGYTFLGWTDDEGELEDVLFYDGVVVSNLTDDVDGEYDLYAVWAANEYTVRFNANGGEGAMSEMGFLYDEAQSLPMNTFTRTGYAFAGWAREAATGMSPPQLADADVVSNLTAEADGVVTLYAVWTANPYTIRFNANGGEGTMTDIGCVYGAETALTANAFTRKGYAFAGWATSEKGPVVYADGASVTSLTAEANGVVTLYAVWQAGANAVSFDGNGGTPFEASRSVLTDAQVGALPSATRTGWTLVGWFTAASGGTQVSADTVITAAVTFFAQWTANAYSVKFDANGGSGTMANESMTYDAEKALTACAFTRVGYTFSGWAAAESGGSTVYADGETVKNLTATAGGTVTLYAKWTPNNYVIDFNPGQGGTGTMSDQPMTYDEEMALYANLFARTGYTFLGWADDESELEEVLFCDGVVVSNLTDEVDGEYDLYAVWAANEYTVRFNANGGEGTMADQSFVYDEAQSLSLNAFTRMGYAFKEWSVAEDGDSTEYADGEVVSNLTAEADGVVTLSAVWTANPYTVRFEANGGEGEMSDMDCTYGVSKQLTFNAFTRVGYAFAGWATSAKGEVVYANGAAIKSIAASGVVTLYAKWTAVSYSVKFNANGGSGSMANESMTYDAEQALAACAFTRTGYAFAGWAAAESGGSTVYADGAVVKNLTATQGAVVNLYATWTANAYMVKFDANGGSGMMADQAFVYDEEQGLEANEFTRIGYTFAGWAAAESGGSTVYADGAVVKNLTATADGVVMLYAKWTPNNYVIDFNPGQGGEGSMSDQPMTYDEEAALYANLFARTGYTFLGWTDDESELEEVLFCDGVVVSNLTDEVDGEFDLYAVWAANEYTVRFNANGGEGTMADQAFLYDVAQNLTSNGFVRAGCEFLGWAATEDGGSTLYADGEAVSNLTTTADGVVNLYAVWDGTATTWMEDADFSAAVANTYDGYVIDEDYNLLGIVQVKTTKQSVKKGEVTITATATVTDANGKKWSYSKGVVELVPAPVGETPTVRDVGVLTGLKCTTKGCLVPEFGVKVGKNGMEGAWGEYAIFGARNGMGTKGDAMLTALEAYKGKWSVTLSAPVAETATVRLQLDVQAKGVVKIAGNWESGAKVSASAQMVMGDRFAYVPVMVKATKTSPALNALLRIGPNAAATGMSPPQAVTLLSEGELVVGGRTAEEMGEPVYLPSEVSAGGKAFSARVAVNELAYPAKFTQKGLPTGLKIDAATGVISGTPTKPGHYVAEVTVTSGLNSKVKETLTIEFDIANYTDALILIKDAYGPCYVGVSAVEQIAAAAGCSVSGLPAGLKWTAKDIVDTKTKTVKTAANTVYGIPTKSGTSTVYFKKTVKEMVNGKQKSVTHQASATFVVEGMQPWAIGTFDGGSSNGIVTLTVAKTGKVSGKWMSGGLTWTLNAASFDAYIPSEQMYVATVIGKSGKLVMTNEIEVTEGGVSSPLFEAWRNEWKEEPLKTRAKNLKGQKVQVGEVLLTVGASGAVTAKGTFGSYSASCSTVLIPTEEADQYKVYLYFPPKTGKFEGFSNVVELEWDGVELRP